MMTPSEGAHVGGPVTLSWDVVPGATKYRYKIAHTNDFPDVEWVEVLTNSAAIPLELGQWYWKIQQFNGFEWSADSDIAEFFHDALPTPTPVFPPEGSSQEGYLTFIWDPVVGAVKYRALWSLDPGFATFFVEETTNTQVATSSRLGVGTWYWKAQASDGTNWSD